MHDNPGAVASELESQQWNMQSQRRQSESTLRFPNDKGFVLSTYISMEVLGDVERYKELLY